MANIEYEVVINAPVALVYDVSQDYSVRYDWDPFPEKIELLDGATAIGKGTRAFVRAKSGMEMEVAFVQVNPPTTAAVKMTKGPFFLHSFAGSWVFRGAADGATRAKFVYSIKVKWWALPFIVERIAGWYFHGAVRKRLDGLKKYCENLSDKPADGTKN